jgi:TrmH family RNA methyltransferase
MSINDKFHVVLVEPEDPLNIGSVARAMMNLGFRHLHLVAPVEYDPDRARITACHAAPLLDRIILHDRFEDAVSEMEDVVALSGRTRARGGLSVTTLSEWSSALPNGEVRETALVFGCESSGLREEHLDLCRRTIRIPSDEECSSFNLAQAVLLVLYEITRTLPDSGAALSSPDPKNDLPTWNDYFQLDRIVESAMKGSGFLREGTPEPVPGVIRNLFRRLPLNRQEMGILLGLFGKIDGTLRRSRAEKADP